LSELASLLHELKERSGRSYAELADRCGVSPSTLHRYCRGHVLPDSYGMVERIALACGAEKAELAELYRWWAQADAARGQDQPVSDAPALVPAASGSDGRRSPWRPRRGLLGVTASLCVLVAVVIAGVTASSPTRETGAREQTPQWVPGPAWSQHPKPVPATFYGVTVNTSSGAMPTFRVGGVRLWDSGTRWSLVEPAKGRYDWTALDRLVDSARHQGLPVLYTLGGTPQWAAPDAPLGPYTDRSRTSPPDDLNDWVRFVQSVARRYTGRIDAYELWAFAPSPQFYTGDAPTLARMTQRASAIIRQTDPHAKVVCPSMGGLWEPASQQFLRDFTAAGGYQNCDAAGVKLYPRHDGDAPERLVDLATLIDRTFRSAGGIHPPLWNTGTAYRIAEARPLDQQHAIAYAVRFYLIGMYLRYERTYFYNWGGTQIPLVLQAAGGPPTLAARAIDTLQRWLAGARITSCGHGRPDGLPSQVWQCRYQLAAPAGRAPVPAVIRWTESGTASMPADTGADTVRTLDGAPVRAKGTLRITEQPTLITLRRA
jgi:hypothetical protein